MLELLRDLGLTFVPIFVAMDVVGVLPIMTTLTEGMTKGEFDRMSRFAIFSALGLGLVFVALGNAIFALMGIEVRDFLIAGGLILFGISAKDLLTGKAIDTDKSANSALVGAVPIGIPLIVGPAVLTTSVLLMHEHGAPVTAAAVTVNIALAGGVAHVQAGCGIVYDSVPEREYDETMNKARALLKAIDQAESPDLTLRRSHAAADR